MNKTVRQFQQQPRGVALLITLGLLSMLIVMVFSLSHRTTLEAHQLNQDQLSLQKHHSLHSVIAVVSSHLKALPPNGSPMAEMKFECMGWQVHCQLMQKKNAFELQRLRDRQDKKAMAELRQSLRRAGLRATGDPFANIDHGDDQLWLDLEAFKTSLKLSTDEHFWSPWLSEHFSVLPKRSVVVKCELTSEAESMVKILIYQPRPDTLTLCRQEDGSTTL